MPLARQAFRREIAPHRQIVFRLAFHPVPFLGAGPHLLARRAGKSRRRLACVDRRRRLRRRKRVDAGRPRSLRSGLRARRQRHNGLRSRCAGPPLRRLPNVLLKRGGALLLLRRAGARSRRRRWRRRLDLCERYARSEKGAGGDRRSARQAAQRRVARADFQWFFLAQAQWRLSSIA
jgi:hypothetical protein